MTVLSDGRIAYVWRYDEGSTATDKMRARIFNPDGTPAGPDIIVSDSTTSDQYGNDIAALPGGRFIVSWSSTDASQAPGPEIHARIFNADGTPAGAEFKMNSTPVNSLSREPDIEVRADGRFIAVWTTGTAGSGGINIQARLFNADGTPSGGDFRVNSGSGTNVDAALGILSDGRFIATWTGDSGNGDGSLTAIRARVFNADGSAAGADFVVNSTTAGWQQGANVAILANGGFVVTWDSQDTGDGSGGCIRARIYNADGTAAGADFIVNTTSDGTQGSADVVALADGRFAVAWDSDDVLATTGGSIRARVFNGDGSAASDEFQVNAGPFGYDKLDPAIAVLANGNIAVTWKHYFFVFGFKVEEVLSTIFDPGPGPSVISGTAGDDSLLGTAVHDVLYGRDGNDVLNGAAGADYMQGGLGNDIYYVDNAGDATDEAGGGGTRDYVFASVSFTAAAGIEGLTLEGAGDINATGRESQNDVLVGNSGNNLLDGRSGADFMQGGLGNDVYYVDSAYDVTDESTGAGTRDYVFAWTSYTAAAGIEGLTLSGTANINATGRDGQADILIGNSGNNVLDGRSGVDFMQGGLGNDVYYVDNAYDTTDETTGGGSDFVYASVSFAAAAGIESLALTGMANINGTGRDGQNDVIYGNSGDNLLDGRSGADYMRGGLGNDVYYVDSVYDMTDETIAGGGTRDYVFAWTSYTAAAGIEGLTLAGTANINATGRGGQNDVLIGNSGNNLLDGRSGADFMQGGLGNDVYYVDSVYDKVDETTGGGIQDYIFAWVSYTAAAGIEGLTLSGTANINAAGRNGQSDTLVGNSGSNKLNGRSGADYMRGGLGNDVYYADNSFDVTDESTGGGVDTVYASASFNASAGIERLFLTGSANINAAGRDGQNDYLAGNAGANYLDGKSGNDVLWGGLGNDTLAGGAGNDVFRFASALNPSANVDTIADFNAANDTIQLDNAIFKALGAGRLAAGLFKNLNLGLADADDRILYNDTTGTVFYDADGSGAGVAIQFAVLTANPTITAADFVVY
jgi:Ca2+-binding RTX toxin-like protein